MSDLLRLTAAVDLTAAAGDGRGPRFEILAYSGGFASAMDFGPFVLDLAGLEMPPTIPILVDHVNMLAAVAGNGRPEVRQGQLHISGNLTEASEGGRLALGLHKSGIRLQASIGTWMIEADRVSEGTTITANGQSIKAGRGGFRLVKRARLFETSLVAVGGDPGSAVSIAARKKGPSTMPDDPIIQTPDAGELAVAQERQRVREIEKIALTHLHGSYLERFTALKASAIRGDITIDSLRTSALDLLKTSSSLEPMVLTPRIGSVSTRQTLEAAFLVRAGKSGLAAKFYGEPAVESVKTIRDPSFVGLCAMGLQIDGKDTGGMGREEMLKAAVSTYSIPLALSNVTGKVLWDAYQESPASWRTFAKVSSASDFKPQTGIRASSFPNLSAVPPGGEVKHGSLSELAYPWSVKQYSEQFQIDRTTIINDDLGFLSAVGPAMAQAALRTLSDLVWTTLIGNAGSFFSSGNSNLLEASSVLDAVSLELAISAMRTQRDAGANDLDIAPYVLVVAPENEMNARTILNSSLIQQAAGTGMGNPMLNSVILAIEPRISNTVKYPTTSAANWYLFAAPMVGAVIVGYLGGQQTPLIETFDPGIDRLGIGIRVLHDFGVALGDYRGAVKATGAV